MILLCTGIASAATYSGGSGTINDPYQLSSDSDIDNLSATSDDWGMNFTLTQDITLVGNHTPIANQSIPFTGDFDGNGYTIKNLTVYTDNKAGFFAYIGNDAYIHDIGIEASSKGIVTSPIASSGILAGSNKGTINNIYVIGNVTGEDAGGLIGENSGGTITNSYANSTVDGLFAGGLIGVNDNANITNCYATGNVSGGFFAGGLIGNNNNANITNCYATGNVASTFSASGLIGENSDANVINCYHSNGLEDTYSTSTSYDNFTNFSFVSGASGLNWNASGNIITTEYNPNFVWRINDGSSLPYFQKHPYSGGSGTIDDPYQLSSDSDIDTLSTTSDDWGMNFTLTGDITLTDNHTPIGQSSPYFTGDFDGNGHLVKNLTIYESNIYVGLFGRTGSTANIHDLGVETSPEGVYSTTDTVGILVGLSSGNVSNCFGTGIVTGNTEVGGLVGSSNGGLVNNCYTNATVNAIASSSYVGGLVGTLNGDTIINSYATGNVSGYNIAGGLVGYIYSGTVSNCFATVNIDADSSSIGGIVGNSGGGSVDTCYYFSNTPDYEATATSYDNFTSYDFISGSSGLNWNEDSSSNTITTEDNSDYIWKIIDGSSLPFFQWQVTGSSSDDSGAYSGGSGTIDDPYQLSTSTAIEDLSSNPDDWGLNFTLTGDITLTGNHTPIGNSSIKFTGDFDGNGHTIKNLTINQESNYAGFFGYTLGANVHDLGIETSSYGIKSTGEYVGGLVGWLEYGTVSNCSFAGTVSGSSDLVGGLVGMNKYGTAISNSSATGNVTGSGSYVGGLVGENWGSTIIDCSATGIVSGSIDCVGGLVGFNRYDLNINTNVSNSYATGDVTGRNRVGGLVGFNDNSTVSTSYATGTVNGSGSSVGGLVGYNDDSATVINSFATGNVSGTGDRVGGLVGYNYDSATVTNSFATGTVSGSSDLVGGLVGYNYDSATVTNSFATGTVSGSNRVGGLVGFNSVGTVNDYCYYSSTGSNYNEIGKSTSYVNFTNLSFVSGSSGLNWDGDITTADDSGFVWKIIEEYTLPYFQWQDTPDPVPYVESLSPSIGFNNTDSSESFWINISGCSFYNTTDSVVVNLTMDGQTPISGEIDEASHTYTTINAIFNLTEAIAGNWSLYVNNLGGQTSTANIFTVKSIVTPDAPEGFTNNTGNFWVNHSWDADTSGTTDSYNISYDGGWDNGTTNNYFNQTSGLSAHAWSNITVYAYNATDSTLSEGVSDKVQIPNNDVTILDVTDITATEGETISFDVNSTDADNDAPTFACNQSDLFDSFDTSSGEVSWITDMSDAGIYSVEFNVSDGHGSVASKAITITVNDFSLSVPVLSNETGNFYVNWSWNSILNADSYNISLNNVWTNGSISTEINETDMDPHNISSIQVLAFNETYGVLSDSVSDSVTLSNNPVSISNLNDISISEYELININALSADPDGDSVTFGCNRTDLFSDFDTSTGNGSWQTGPTDSGIYSVEFNVSDGYGSIDSQTITITVTDFSLSTPVLSNETGNFYVNWSWNSISNADSYNVSLNNVWTNGSISTEINETDMDPHNISSIQVLAFNETYGVLSDSVSDSVTLSNNPVSISNLNDISISEYELININALSADPDGDSVTFGCNRTDLFSDFDTSTGNGSWQTGPTDAGTYSVEFNVSDGYGSIDTEIITITVNDFSLSTPVLSNETGNFYVNWSWNSISNADSYNVSLNNVWTNGTISTEINETDMDPHNISSIQVLAFNETYGVLSDSVSDSVTLSNNPVSISNLDDIGVNESELIEINAVFEDLDDDSVTFGCNRTDLFSDFDTSTGNGSWETDYTSSGTYSVNFNVSDGYGSTDSQVVTVTVTNVPTTMHVGSGSDYDYPGIQAAINAASEGDTISVTDGTYNENVVVNKSVTLRSENGSANTVINSTSGNTVLTLEADNITIMGFNITGASGGHGIRLSSSSNNSTLENNIVTNNGDGIVLYPSHNNTLKNNIIIENNGDGIYIEHSFNTILTENNVSVNDGNGINIAYSSNYSVLTNNIVNGNSDGIKLYTSNNTILTSNIVNGNDEFGIYFDTSENNTIVGNVANDNLLAGIYLDSSGNNTLQNNVAKGSTYFGFYLDSSSSNVLENNTAMNNTVYDFAVSGTNEINNLKITEKGAQVSFLSDSTETGIRGSATNSTALLGKTNVNGYLTIKRGGISVKSTSVVVDKESSAPDIIISYDDSGMSSPVESSIDLYRYSESKWNAVSDTSLDTSSNKVTAALSEGTFGLFKNSGSSSDSSSSSDDGSVVARLQSKGTTAILYTNSDGELNGDTVVKSKNAITTLTLYKGTVGTDAAGNTVNKVTVTKPESMPANTPAEVLESGLYYDFGPSGTTFNKEVLITIDFDPEEYQDRNPTIYTHSEENGWIALETTIDWENGRATAYTTHFSLYALFGDDAGEVVEETSQVSAESPKHVEDGEIPAEDKGGFGFVYLILGIVIVAGIGYVIMKKQKDGGGL